MTEFTDEYANLLIKQYWDKPKAKAEIVALASIWESIKDIFADFPDQFDIDSTIVESELGLFDGSVLGIFGGGVLGVSGQSAIGDRLNIIGKIVGLRRTGLLAEIDDETYRFLLKIKIAQNNASAFLVSDDKITIQDVIELAFNGDGVVTDNQDMSLTLYIESESITSAMLNLVVNYNLLPKPQGVRYDVIANLGGGTPFGYAELGSSAPTNVIGYSELTYAPDAGGEYAELYEA